MEFEENEYRRALYAILIHVVAWVFLCYMRRKHFSIPSTLGMLTFNLFAVTMFYLQSYSLAANTIGDPNTKVIWQTMVVSDCFFGWLYCVLGDYLFPSGHFWFCTFPKFFFAVCFYFFFDDRGWQILYQYLGTSALTLLSGLAYEELLGDCYHD
jgi:hypothetical protein